jgi:hypothetical protein
VTSSNANCQFLFYLFVLRRGESNARRDTTAEKSGFKPFLICAPNTSSKVGTEANPDSVASRRYCAIIPSMPITDILALLRLEQQKISAAIAALESGGNTTPRRGRPRKDPLADAPSWVTGQPEKPERKKRKFSAKQRAEQALRMKKYWAAKKTAAAKGAKS